jgi:tripartite-type tricarboxylate transporter receptor subunit TctC
VTSVAALAGIPRRADCRRGRRSRLFRGERYGLFAPAKTPWDVIDLLNKSAAVAMQSEAFRKLGVNEGLAMVAAPPEELDRYFRGAEERWRKVIQGAGITAE